MGLKNKMQKNFVPSIMQASTSITLVWDNNDINPESLRGIAMHCTNGITVQLADSAPSLVTDSQVSNCLARKREQSFKGMPIVDPIISRKSSVLAMHNAELLPASEWDLYSRSLDNAWVILRYQASSHGIKLAVPKWTGYNCLIVKKSDSNHHQSWKPLQNFFNRQK